MKKILAVALSVALIVTSAPTREVEASWFTDLMGGIFTVITSPILLVAKDNPTLRKNNPFRKKVWEEEAEKEKEAEKILRRLSSQQSVSQPATQQQPEQIVIEKTVEIVREVVKDNSAEIETMKKEIDEMKKDAAAKTTEIATLQSIVDSVKDGRDVLGFQSFPFANFGRGFDFVTEGNVTKIVVDMPEPQVVPVQPTMTSERDRRKFWGIAATAIITLLIAKLFYVNPKIDVVQFNWVYKDVTPKLSVFLKTSAIVVSQYFVYKFVNKRLTPEEIWSDAKGLTSDASHAVVDVVNGTYQVAKNYIAYPVANKTSSTAKKVYDWEYFWTAVTVVSVVVVALTGVFFYARHARARRAGKLSSGSLGLPADLTSSMGVQNVGSFAPESVTQSGNLKTSPHVSATASGKSSASASGKTSGQTTPQGSAQGSAQISPSSSGTLTTTNAAAAAAPAAAPAQAPAAAPHVSFPAAAPATAGLPLLNAQPA